MTIVCSDFPETIPFIANTEEITRARRYQTVIARASPAAFNCGHSCTRLHGHESVRLLRLRFLNSVEFVPWMHMRGEALPLFFFGFFSFLQALQKCFRTLDGTRADTRGRGWGKPVFEERRTKVQGDKPKNGIFIQSVKIWSVFLFFLERTSPWDPEAEEVSLSPPLFLSLPVCYYSSRTVDPEQPGSRRCCALPRTTANRPRSKRMGCFYTEGDGALL